MVAPTKANVEGFHKLLTRFCEELASAHDWELSELQSRAQETTLDVGAPITPEGSLQDEKLTMEDMSSNSSPAVSNKPQSEQTTAPKDSRVTNNSLLACMESKPKLSALRASTPTRPSGSDSASVIKRSIGFDDAALEKQFSDDAKEESGVRPSIAGMSDNRNDNESTPTRGASSGTFVASNRQMVEDSMTNAVCYSKRAAKGWTKDSLLMVLEFVASIVILLNSVVIGLSTDWDPEWLGWIVIDTMFAVCFIIELGIKLVMLGCKTYFFGVGATWNIFDSVLTLSAVIEVTISFIELGRNEQQDKDSVNVSFFRVMRLVRIVKITRLARVPFLTELMMMLQGALGGAKTFFWSLVLISVPVYMVALVLRETLGSSAEEGGGAEEFSNIGRSFFTVFRCCVAMDCTEESGQPVALLVTRNHGFLYGMLYCFTTALFTFGLFNILTAIYVENVVDAAKRNEALRKARTMADSDHLTEMIQEMMMVIWEVYGGSEVDPVSQDDALQEVARIDIDAAMFQELCNNKRFQEVLSALGIAEEDRTDLFDTLDVDGRRSLGLHDMVMGIVKLRGQPRRSDIVGLGLVVRNVQQEQKKFHAAVTKQMKMAHSAVMEHLRDMEER